MVCVFVLLERTYESDGMHEIVIQEKVGGYHKCSSATKSADRSVVRCIVGMNILVESTKEGDTCKAERYHGFNNFRQRTWYN